LRPGPRRLSAGITARNLAQLERAVYNRVDAVWVCSDEDRVIALKIAPHCNAWTVPNGVETDRMAPRAGDAAAPSSGVFFGKLDYFPNVDAIEYLARDIVPRIRKSEPAFTLTLAGPAATERVRELARSTPGLRYVGRVDDVRELLASAAVVLVPLRVGGGTRLKIVEAMAAGRPIVTTTVGAEGIEVRHDRDMMLADTTAEFVDATIALLRDPARGNRLGEAARMTAVKTYDWTVIGEIVRGSIDRLLAEFADT
jgi:glycosyltransferase involved in cell wall biosynthesis